MKKGYTLTELVCVIALITLIALLLFRAAFGAWMDYRFSHQNRFFNWKEHTQESFEDEDGLYRRLLGFEPDEQEKKYYADYVRAHLERDKKKEEEMRKQGKTYSEDGW